MDNHKLSRIIRTRRKFLKLNQIDLAELVGVSERTIRDIERGIANPEVKTIFRICEVLGLEIIIKVPQQ